MLRPQCRCATYVMPSPRTGHARTEGCEFDHNIIIAHRRLQSSVPKGVQFCTEGCKLGTPKGVNCEHAQLLVVAAGRRRAQHAK
eukprot:6187398-Pleurochrysis_carterae.AAC.1